MNPLDFVVTTLVFLSAFLAGVGIRLAYQGHREQRTKERLRDLTRDVDPDVQYTVLRDMKYSAVPLLDRILQRLRFVHRIENLLLQADVSMRVGAFCLLVLTLGSLGAFVAAEVFSKPMLIPPAVVFPAAVPVIVVIRKRQKRLRMFEELLPDALDLMTGALRSGMAFSGALQVVAEESPDPISKEFTIVFEEHRLGMDMQESFRSMTRRVDSRELRIFVTAVLLQRETGGNLVEILEGTADIIRDRFRILGDVRTLTAQARLSGVILAILPIAMAFILTLIAPDYLRILIEDRIGFILITAAIGLQILGYFVIRRIIAIKV